MLHSFRLHNSLTWGRAIALAMLISPRSEAICQLWWNYSKTLELGIGDYLVQTRFIASLQLFSEDK
ncbi:hypothetical protein HCG51_22650 [Tolypothrix sp. PCC 7910]|nr:hypothetical protein HCG51_22650 [Tolypothrix sp. PCC 7910]